MKFVDEFRDPDAIARTCDEIRRLADPGRHYRLMEVCGGHTHAIYRFGLKDVLPSNIELIHGPGCPVCVLPMGRIDDGLALAREPRVTFAAFGDMMRVPGAHGSPLERKAQGLDVRIVYSPTDALKLGPGRSRPPRDVLRHRVRDHGALDGAHAAARQGRGDHLLFAAGAPEALVMTSANRSSEPIAYEIPMPPCASPAAT